MEKVKKGDIESVKEEGNKAFKDKQYYKAIMMYEEAVKRCGVYLKECGG